MTENPARPLASADEIARWSEETALDIVSGLSDAGVTVTPEQQRDLEDGLADWLDTVHPADRATRLGVDPALIRGDDRDPNMCPCGRVPKSGCDGDNCREDDLSDKRLRKIFVPGARVRLIRAIDRSPDFVAPAGAIGTVTEQTDDDLFIRLDEYHFGAEEWDNQVQWRWHDDDRDTLGQHVALMDDQTPQDEAAVAAVLARCAAARDAWERDNERARDLLSPRPAPPEGAIPPRGYDDLHREMIGLLREAQAALNWQGAEYLARRIATCLAKVGGS